MSHRAIGRTIPLFKRQVRGQGDGVDVKFHDPGRETAACLRLSSCVYAAQMEEISAFFSSVCMCMYIGVCVKVGVEPEGGILQCVA